MEEEEEDMEEVSFDSIAELLSQAEKTVSKIRDPSLRPIAFQFLLQAFAPGSPDLSLEEKPPRRRGNPRPAGTSKRASKGPVGRLRGLKEEKFFSKPRSIGEIVTELSHQGFHYKQENLSGSLIRLVQQKELRRLKSDVEGKTIYRYCNP